jgi:sugar/nucleoside kinase (ribokinase family)
MFRYDVLCVGSATVDTFLCVKEKISAIRPGDKILVNKTEVHSGGGATNAAAALATLGIKTKMLSKLGNDHNAHFIQREMKQYGVSNISQHCSRKGTDFATIVSSTGERDRVIFVHKGASRDLAETDYKKSHLRVKWLYLASLVGKSFKTGEILAAYVKKKGGKILFNPSLYLAERGTKVLRSLLRITDLLILNKEEATALLNSSDSIPQLLRKLGKLGPSSIIITDGTRKLYALDDEVVYFLTPPPVPVVHTAGAGDAFNSGVLAGILKKYSFEDALRLGQANASSVIKYIGTKNKLLTEAGAQRLIKKLRFTIHKNEA